MLIIFDLDDTLIDTTGSITPHVLQNAFNRFNAMGGQFEEKAFSQLSRLYTLAQRGKDGLSEFLELHGQSHLYEAALEEIYQKPSLPDKIECTPTALEVLKDLRKRHSLALVTGGYDDVQREKLKRSGIDEHIFNHVEVEPLSQKKTAYKKILEKVGLKASQIVVCGDRIELDLTPAKQLGFKTVHFRFGRGLGNTGLKSDVDYTILQLEELMDLLPRIESFA